MRSLIIKLICLSSTLIPLGLLAQVEDSVYRPKVGVVLSGGGAKGYAHIGALKVIEEAGIKVDYIGGTSMGAIVGGLYAAGYAPDELEHLISTIDLSGLFVGDKSRSEIPFFEKRYKEKYIFELPFNNFKLKLPNAISTGQGPMETLTYLFRHVHDISNFDKLPIPFICIATNLETGEPKVFRSGYLPEVVLASGAYPTLIEPVKIDGQIYVDGGIVNNFPVQEVIDMGADIIIGVDLDDGLKDRDKLSSAPDIIEQIISFTIVRKTKKQRELVNILIKPILKGYTVTSFEQTAPILNAGIDAANLKIEELKAVARERGYKEVKRYKVENEEFVLITGTKINGLHIFNTAYVQGILNIKTPQLVSYSAIKDGILKLYSSGNFQKISYRILPSEDGFKELHLNVIENPNQQSLRFGIHYDDLFKTGLLINYTSKRVLFKNSILSADFVFGDFPRYSVNYFVDNGYFPSFGVNSSLKHFTKEVNPGIIWADDLDSQLGKINYRSLELNNQIYVQSTNAQKYAIGVGLEHQYIDIHTNNLKIEKYKNMEKSHFLKGFSYLKADTRDNPNFPSKGFMFDANFEYILASKEADNTSLLETSAEIILPINRNISYKATGSIGTFFNKEIPNSQKFLLGGYVEQSFLNYVKFYGLPFAHQAGSSKLILGSTLQYKILKNHYISGFVNIGNIENEFQDIRYFKYTYAGFGLSYAYDSVFGPLSGYWTYSPSEGEALFNISLGFWF